MVNKGNAKSWIIGKFASGSGEIPVVNTRLTFSDRLGAWRVRWGIARARYRIEPGLYGAGNPTPQSPVFVSANYKLSFDRLRSNLAGIDGWILVLDTRGINVWCAAGKGTFGTDEIVRRIRAVGLENFVSHRKLIVPQLGATGVSAHRVRELCGFHVIYGPVRASDIPTFLKAGKKASPEMRRVRFSFGDRAVLVPNELVQNARYLLPVAAGLILLAGFGPNIYSLDRAARIGITSAVVLAISYVIGLTIPALLLPWLPGRAFSAKGAWIGFVLAAILGAYLQRNGLFYLGELSFLGWLFMIPAVTSFTAMNFTGCSTFTSLSGVRKEMKVAVPLQITFAVIGVGLWITGLFV